MTPLSRERISRIPRTCEDCGEPIEVRELYVRVSLPPAERRGPFDHRIIHADCTHRTIGWNHPISPIHGRRRTTDEQRFWAKVNRTDSCWLWTGSLSNGYGNCRFRGRTRGAHQVAYELRVGPVPDGLQLDHLCRVRACVNPAHLEAVTQQVNIFRGASPVAANAAKTHCANGHEFTPENTHHRAEGGRRCLTCQRAAMRRFKEGVKADPEARARVNAYRRRVRAEKRQGAAA